MKICFVSALFTNNIDNFGLSGKFEINKNYDYFLFTNVSKSSFNTSWTLINLEICFDSDILASRYVKFKIWEYFKEKKYTL